jgi:hypothetical protein
MGDANCTAANHVAQVYAAAMDLSCRLAAYLAAHTPICQAIGTAALNKAARSKHRPKREVQCIAKRVDHKDFHCLPHGPAK